jgi:hypothetical protein
MPDLVCNRESKPCFWHSSAHTDFIDKPIGYQQEPCRGYNPGFVVDVRAGIWRNRARSRGRREQILPVGTNPIRWTWLLSTRLSGQEKRRE